VRGFIAAALLALLCSGCATATVIRDAQGHAYVNAEGETVVTKEREPDYYLLVPFAVALDIILSPYYLYGWATGKFDDGV
jgi:uncharacterized protein YceK